MKDNFLIEKTEQGYLLYTIVNGFLFKKHYIDYSKKEARELFREEIKKEENKNGKTLESIGFVEEFYKI